MPIGRSQKTSLVQGTVSQTALTLVTFGFTADQVSAADRVIISITSGALRLTWDDALTTPTTAGVGMLVPAANYPLFVLEGRISAAKLQMIRNGGVDAAINVTLEFV